MDFVEPLAAWYRAGHRALPWRENKDAYRIWISEIMLQQTRVAAVVDYFTRFLAAFPDVCALAEADDDRLMKLWEGLGYYSRARNLKKAARLVVSDFGGILPASYEQLLTLPGIGSYTAGAIASIAYGIPVPAVDGNVLRVIARLTNDASDIADPKTKEQVFRLLLPELCKTDPGTLNQALMELGATVCVPNGAPNCALCPVRAFCRARMAGTEAVLPVKSAKKPRKTEEKTVFALKTQDGRFLGLRRPETGLLAGMYQLPEAEGFLSPAQMAEHLTALGFSPSGALAVYDRKHVFTHVEWRMRVCCAAGTLRALPAGLLLLDERHALPTAYRVCLPESDG